MLRNTLKFGEISMQVRSIVYENVKNGYRENLIIGAL